MVYINEWLPNPSGPDGNKEFIELYNSGPTSINLSGWSIAADQKKRVLLPARVIASNGYALFWKSDTKLALKNTSGGLFLYGPNAVLVDSASFVGSAQDGRSFSRVNYSASPVQHFAFTIPTPGAKNKSANIIIAARQYPFNVPLNHPVSFPGFLGFMVGVTAMLPLLFIYVIKKNENLSKLFFPGD